MVVHLVELEVCQHGVVCTMVAKTGVYQCVAISADVCDAKREILITALSNVLCDLKMIPSHYSSQRVLLEKSQSIVSTYFFKSIIFQAPMHNLVGQSLI